jgi:hypothetical protein
LNLIRHALLTASKDSDRGIGRTTVRSIMIEVLGSYGSEDIPIGTRRRFVVFDGDGRQRIQGKNSKQHKSEEAGTEAADS